MASAEPAAPPLSVMVTWSPAAGEVLEVPLHLPAGSTLLQAVRASGLAVPEPLDAGIWGKLRPLETPLRDGDRVELYRPLRVDPKEARRQRHARQGIRPRVRR